MAAGVFFKPRYCYKQDMRYMNLVLLLFSLLVTGCSADENAETGSNTKKDTEPRNYIETGDLDDIRKRGQLRILTLKESETYLPREGDDPSMEQELATQFARDLKLRPVRIYVDSFQELIPALLEGRGDLIAADMRITDARMKEVSFTVPLQFTHEQLVGRADDKINSLKQLRGRHIAVLPGTSFVGTLESIKKKHPYLEYELLPAGQPLDTTLDRLAAGEIDLTVVDSVAMKVVADYRTDVDAKLDLSGAVPLAWAIRPGNTKLLASLNRFLDLQLITSSHDKLYTGDLDTLKKHKTLRLITRNNAASYFLWKGELMGFEYEMFKRFAKKQGLRLQVVVAPSHEDMIPMLLRGEGDVVAALLTPNDTRRDQGIVFSRPYLYTTRQLVGRIDEPEITDPAKLGDRTLIIRRSSDYWQTAETLAEQNKDLKLQAAPEDLATEEIIGRVAKGEYDLTLADTIVLDLETTWRDDIKGLLLISGDKQPIAAALRPQDKELLQALNAFFKKDYRGLMYNISYKKYFGSPHAITTRQTQRIQENSAGHISPYDDIVKKYAEQHGFDWRMIVAQMYQESRFDPKRKSWVGAEGLLQVMPRTARAHGFKSADLSNPQIGIEAGIVYLNWLRERFPSELDVRDRIWFSLASYNAGLGHVRDAQSLARKKGWNPNKWFGNVEQAMLLLSKPEYHKKAKHGYVRGREPVRYVRDIYNRYQAYVESTGDKPDELAYSSSSQ
jgi:membrane-bound lytic murein transglycosylase F